MGCLPRATSDWSCSISAARRKENRDKLQKSQKAELDVRRERQRLEDEKTAFELNFTRRLDEERALVREQAKREASEERRFEDARKDKKIEDLTRKISELEQLAASGPPGDIGEAAESTLEEDLRHEFPHDVIKPVATDGDVIQEVRDGGGHLCGSVLWESKRTKKWQEPWLAKAREDQQKRGADVAVIVTVAMPKEVSTLGCKDGVWVANHHCFDRRCQVASPRHDGSRSHQMCRRDQANEVAAVAWLLAQHGVSPAGRGHPRSNRGHEEGPRHREPPRMKRPGRNGIANWIRPIAMSRKCTAASTAFWAAPCR